MRFLRIAAVIFALLVFAGAVLIGFLYIASGGEIVGFVRTAIIRIQLTGRQEELNQPAGSDQTPQRFTIQAGDSPLLIAQRLEDAGLILDADLFVDYIRVEGLDVELEAGTYFVRQTQTIPEIAVLLTDSSRSSITFTIFEGTRREEIAARIDASTLFGFSGEAFLEAVGPGTQIDPSFAQTMGIPTGAALEGFLFPDTYVLPPDITAAGLRDELLETFQRRTEPQWIEDAAQDGFTMYEIVTLASIVEREAVRGDEYPLIASVYRNRLAIGQALEADPTVQYALNNARGTWWPDLTVQDYRQVDSPFNTYLYRGLPPGPIANPGAEAIRATVYPAQTDYYFFRARCDESGYHNFARTFEEHLANAC